MPWRLIRSGSQSGAMNMAIDDALLQAVAAGDSPPVLRLYRWQPATLTLGYAQPAGLGVDLAACRACGIDVVRRPTGGRAVLHDREATYAVIAPATSPFGPSVNECYRVVAGALRAALRSCGLPAELVPGRPRGAQGQAVCFTAAAQHELVIDGCKVAGCAQKRRGTTFLQHGSIPVDLDLDLMRRVLPAGPEATGDRDLRQSVGWLNRYAARTLTVDEVENALVESFADVLGIRLVASGLTPAESAAASRLCARFYADPGWTLTGPGHSDRLRPAMTIE